MAFDDRIIPALFFDSCSYKPVRGDTMMKAPYLQQKHEAGVPYEQYVRSGTDQQRENWQTIYDQTRLTDGQRELIGRFTRRIKRVRMMSAVESPRRGPRSWVSAL